MPRTARASKGGFCYHLINRGNARATVFHDSRDYESFLELMIKACGRIRMRLLAFCLMPNHFHLVIWPYHDGDMGRWMHWLLTCHVGRHHRRYETSGRIWQGRFKAFPIEQDEHLLTVMRYVERNPVRANLVQSAADWDWSSISHSLDPAARALICPNPVKRPENWLKWVDEPQTAAEMEALRLSVQREAPFGGQRWRLETARLLGLR